MIIVDDLAIMLLGIIIVLVVAWMTSNRLLNRIRERERSLVYRSGRTQVRGGAPATNRSL